MDNDPEATSSTSQSSTPMSPAPTRPLPPIPKTPNLKPDQRNLLMDKMTLHNQMRAYLNRGDQPGSPAAPFVPYGPTGFRAPANRMSHLAYRAGIVASLRCFFVRRNIGVMVTGSHSPVDENGIKFIDVSGEMITSYWQPILDKLCNAIDPKVFCERFELVVNKYDIKLDSTPTKGKVLIAHDTRPSSENLAAIVVEGILVGGFNLIYHHFYGLMTTPQLHYMVAASNRKRPSIQPRHYYEKTINGVIRCFIIPRKKNPVKVWKKDVLVVDCANGVTREIVHEHMELGGVLGPYIQLKAINIGAGGAVENENCGADYVITSRKPPVGANDPSKRYASLDGDGDRVIFFYLKPIPDSQELDLRILNGDKILALMGLFIKTLLNNSVHANVLTSGCVQTIYANTASTDFLKKLGYRVDFVEASPKNLHRRARSEFDVGLYFDTNGHGTITLSEKARRCFDKFGLRNAYLRGIRPIVNRFVGDGLAGMLLVEVMLMYFDWTTEQWDAIYQETPNRLVQLALKDRSVVKLADGGRLCISPPGLQEEINSIVSGCAQAKCLVRPSTTSNLVSIYTEAANQSLADEIAHLVGTKLIELSKRM